MTVTSYFEKYRSLATGIAVCGSGLGTFIFAPFTEWLITKLGWRGAMIVMGILVMKCIIYGILFRPLKSSANNEVSMEEFHKSKENNSVITVNGGGEEQKRPHSVHTFVPPQQANGVTVCVVDTDEGDVVKSALSQPMLMSQTTVEIGGRVRLHSESSSVRSVQSGIMYRKDVLYRGSLHNLPPEQRYVLRDLFC